MKKRVLAIAMSLAMTLSLLPVSALAEETGETDVETTESDVIPQASGQITADTESLTEGDYYLSSNVKLNSALTIAAGADVTIDLGGFTLTLPNTQATEISGGSNVEISNGSIVAKSISDGTVALFNIETGSSITLDDVDVDTTGAALFPRGDAASVTVQNGSVIKAGVYAVGTNAAKTDNYNVVITLQDSEFIGEYGYNNNYQTDNCPVMINVEGVLNIDNCTITGDRQGVLVRAGTATINDSTITTTGTYTDADQYYNSAWGSGDEVPAAALTVGNYQNGAASAYLAEANVTLTNTVLNAENDFAALYVDANTTYKGVVSISGDDTEVNGSIVKGQQTALGQIDISITGGTFSKKPDDSYIATSYEVTGEGPYTVEPASNMSAETEANVQTGSSSATVSGSFSGNESAENTAGENAGTVDAQGGSVTINVQTGTSGEGDTQQPAPNGAVSSTEVTVDKVSMESVANRNVDVLLETDVADLTIPSEAWNSMTDAANGQSVVISVKENKSGDTVTGWEVTATAGSTNVFAAENSVGRINIRVSFSAGEDVTDVQVYCIDTSEWMVSSWNNSTLSWLTSHFTTFAPVEIKSADQATWVTKGENPTTGSGTLEQAIAAMASNGGTITLNQDIELQDKDAAVLANNSAVLTLPANTTLNGNNKKITAVGTWNNIHHILGVSNADGVVIQDLTIIGNAGTKHGINVWTGSSVQDKSEVTIENVTIQSCGTAAVVVNNSEVTAINLITSGNPWGAVNVDNNGAFTLRGDNNSMSEPVKIWTEKPESVEIALTDSNFSSFEDVAGVGNNLKGYTYYTDDVSELGEAYNETDNTIYEDLDTALNSSSVSSGDTVVVMKDATLDANATIPEGVTLVVDEGVTLTIASGQTLTNDGTIENSGTITGTVSGSGTTEYQVTFTTTPNSATVTVTGQGSGKTYMLASGTYSYTVSASGYRTATGSFTVPNTRDIHVALSSNSGNQSSSGNSGSSSSDSGDYLITVDRVSGGRVTVQPGRADKGDTVTITVYPNDGYELDELVVTDSRGNEIDLDARSATRFTFTMPSGKVTVEASFVREGGQTQTPQTTFADVPASAWYYNAVEYVYENGLMSGVSGGRFAPDDTLTRAMLVQTLYAMEGRPAAASAGFADVASGDWYASAVNWAAANGVVSGVSETGFGPNNALTREQLALILYRFAQYKGYDVTGTSDLAAYADGSSVSGWAAEAMGWAVDAGLISGVGGNQIAPTGTASRAQVAQILMNFCENVAR